MPTSTPSFDVTLTRHWVAVILDALHQKAAEVEYYLAAYPKSLDPGPLDTCCAAHRHRFETRVSERAALASQRAQIRDLIGLFDHAEARCEDTGPQTQRLIDLSGITLVYRDKNGTSRTQPLPDIPSAGVLIDPDTGDDLELASALVRNSVGASRNQATAEYTMRVGFSSTAARAEQLCDAVSFLFYDAFNVDSLVSLEKTASPTHRVDPDEPAGTSSRMHPRLGIVVTSETTGLIYLYNPANRMYSAFEQAVGDEINPEELPADATHVR